jgi:hypothetical protein
VSRDKDQLEYLVNSQTQRIGELQDKVERLLDWGSGDDANGAGVAGTPTSLRDQSFDCPAVLY